MILERLGIYKPFRAQVVEHRRITRGMLDLRMAGAPDPDQARRDASAIAEENEREARTVREANRAHLEIDPSVGAAREAERAEMDRREALRRRGQRLVAGREGKAVVLKTQDELEVDAVQARLDQQSRTVDYGMAYLGASHTHGPLCGTMVHRHPFDY